MRSAAMLLGAIVATAGASSAMATVFAQIEIEARDPVTNALIGNPFLWVIQNPGATGSSNTWGSLDPDASSYIADVGGVKIHGVSFSWADDPQVTSSFNLSQGPSNSILVVNSSIVSFTPIPTPFAIASASISVTDSLLLGDVGSLAYAGSQPGGNAFSALYSGTGNTFQNLISDSLTFTNDPLQQGSTHTYSGANPSFPFYDTVAGSASDIRSQFRFSLSRFDKVSGSSTYTIVPAPGAAAVLGLGGLLAGRRRRASVSR